MRIGIMTPGLNPKDAIGNDVLGMYHAFLSRGDEPFIFTPHDVEESPIPTMHYTDAPYVLDSRDDVLIYHYCIADQPAMSCIRRMRCKVFIRYHNVTPAIMMSRYSSAVTRTCRLGRELVTTFADTAVDGYISDSEFNAAELLSLGIPLRSSRIAPPLHRIDDLVGLPVDHEVDQVLAANAYNVLAVGRVVPNKGFDLMCQSFVEALRSGPVDFHLHLVGAHDPRMQLYIDLIGRILVDHGVRGKFTFHGSISPAALVTLYRNCDLFWINSLHEGFCVPAVEAMAFGLPILSSTYGALPETCGDAAEYGHSVSDFAAKVVKLLSDDHARCALGSKGRERYEQRFGGAGLRNHFLAMFDELLGSLAKPVPAASLPRDGYWFHLPDAEWLIDTAISVSGPLPVNALDGRERRADFVDWILRDAWRSSSEIAEYLTGRAFMEYASDIEVPVGGRYLSARQRLIWKFHRFASCRFDLQNGQAVADYMQWFNREATGLYGLMPGELEVERATTSDFPVINVKPRLAGPVDLLPNESRAFQ